MIYNFTAVAQKIKEVGPLQEAITSGALNVSTARRMTSVITANNAQEWIAKAQTLTVRALEKEVARISPRSEVKERASYLNSKRVRLELGLSETLMLKLRRIQDLESQRQRRGVTLEDTFAALIAVYLSKNDPIERAKRAEVRGRARFSTWQKSQRMQTAVTKTDLDKTCTHKTDKMEQSITRRSLIPAHIRHKVHLRDRGQCQYINRHTQERCGQGRHIELHHIRPLYQGGMHVVENLVTLCSEHHKAQHHKA